MTIRNRMAWMPHLSGSIGAGCSSSLFLTSRPRRCLYSQTGLIRGTSAVRGAGRCVFTAFPDRSTAFAATASEDGTPFMLPGFRFLFAAIVLATSMLIFGLGAAALLRAAHEEFASIPSRRAPPETVFAQQNDARPTLAILRVEPSAADEKAAEPQREPMATALSEQPASASTPAEPEKPATEPDRIAALTDIASPAENSSPAEAPGPELSTPENPARAETPAQSGAPSLAAETKVAAIAETPPTAPNEIAATAPATAPVDDSTRIAETRIATLGGPPVTIETRAPAKIAPVAARKPVQAKRAVKRRRIVTRARTAQQASQKPADPFAQPLGR
jgi:hypothetical protein